MKQDFKFWCPITISKGQEVLDPTTGEKRMVLGGIASTSDKDSDDEYLDPNGFDIQPLLKSGVVNWHHQAKGNPAAIIGEPTVAEIRPEGLYIETQLYENSEIARDVYKLAETLEKDSKTRRLGYSIEGKVLKRKSNNKNSPDYNKITKAVITGVAITHMPKNPKTFANIIKGEIDDDYKEEYENEELSEVSAEITKAKILERLFNDVPGISLAKANKVHSLIQNIATMKGKKSITEDDITKAYEALGLSVESTDVEKGCGDKDTNLAKSDETKETEETEETKKTETKEETTEETEDEETEDTEETEEETEDETEKGKKGVEKGNRFDRLEKAIATSHQITSKYVKALGVMVKDAAIKLDAAAERENEMMNIIKAQEETISEMSERLEAYGSETPAPRSISSARAIERHFDKGEDPEIEKGGKGKENQISMSRNPKAVVELLDQATFAKGFDDEMSKACVSFEANKTLPASIIARIKNEFGYEIVK